MSHSLTKIWIHAIWGTKERAQLIRPEIEQMLYQYISEELTEIGCKPKIINGMPDHIHCLFLLSQQRSIADVVKQIKGTSSHLINQTDLIPEKFAWQTGYAAYSVSESIVNKVFNYIKNQKQHHITKNYLEEHKDLLELHGLVER